MSAIFDVILARLTGGKHTGVPLDTEPRELLPRSDAPDLWRLLTARPANHEPHALRWASIDALVEWLRFCAVGDARVVQGEER